MFSIPYGSQNSTQFSFFVSVSHWNHSHVFAFGATCVRGLWKFYVFAHHDIMLHFLKETVEATEIYMSVSDVLKEMRECMRLNFKSAHYFIIRASEHWFSAGIDDDSIGIGSYIRYESIDVYDYFMECQKTDKKPRKGLNALCSMVVGLINGTLFKGICLSIGSVTGKLLINLTLHLAINGGR